MLARRFLGCVFVLVLLGVAAAFAIYQFGGKVLTRSMTPVGHYAPPPKGEAVPDYTAPASWLSRPGDGRALAEWLPNQADGSPPLPPTLQPKRAATFFIHPTTFLERSRWNAPLAPGGESEGRSQLFVRSQASAFNDVSTVYAPRYRQAAIGAFLLDSKDARAALDLAYGDVLRAFDQFLTEVAPGQPLILAGHSQGARHLLRLLRDRKAVLKGRLVAAYVGGWPVGVTADLPATGLPPCDKPSDTGCVLSWQSFGSPANPQMILDAWEGTTGLAGPARTRADMLCVDPVSGRRDGAGAVADNPGTLVPSADFSTATLQPHLLATRCEGGLLLVDGKLPAMGPFALPGNNLHPYDYALNWGAIRADAARRLAAFAPTPPSNRGATAMPAPAAPPPAPALPAPR